MSPARELSSYSNFVAEGLAVGPTYNAFRLKHGCI